MKYSLYSGKEPNLQKLVIVSAIMHFIFISIAAVPFRSGDREFRSYHVRLVAPLSPPKSRRGSPSVRPGKEEAVPAIKPRRKLPPKAVIKTPPKAAVKVSPKADVTLEPSDRVAREISRLRALSALSRKKSERGGDREIEVVRKEAPGVPAGAVGMPGEGSHMNSSSYYALITEKIWSQWLYPGAETTGLEAIISIKIDKEGTIVSQEMEKSSGNRLFDRSAVKALSLASPLPPPPVEMEIGVRFYL